MNRPKVHVTNPKSMMVGTAKWRKTSEPTIAHVRKRGYRLSCLVYSRKSQKRGIKTSSGYFSTKKEAESAKAQWRSSLEGRSAVREPPGSKSTSCARLNVSQQKAFKRVRKSLGWIKMSLEDWINHPLLKDADKLENIDADTASVHAIPVETMYLSEATLTTFDTCRERWNF